jgi:hypothetical protein
LPLSPTVIHKQSQLKVQFLIQSVFHRVVEIEIDSSLY